MKNLKRNVLISLVICLAFLFRVSFISFFHTPASASFAGGAALKAVSIHKGKKRRRMLYYFSKAEAAFAARIQKAAAVIRNRATTFFTSFALALACAPGKNSTAPLLAPRTPPGFSPRSLRKHLSLSILRV